MLVNNALWLRLLSLALVSLSLVACGTQAPYMRGWNLSPRHTHRWMGGEIKTHKLSDDEKSVYTELGPPQTIRLFRALHTRQRVYEWLYEESAQTVWFVDGKRVDYVVVDAGTSSLTKETRETVREKLTKGSLLAGAVGGFAASTLLFGKTLGLKD